MNIPLKAKSSRKILLLTPPYDLKERGGILASVAADLPSLGLLYLAGFLRDKGYETAICDASAEKLSFAQLLGIIKKSDASLIGISSTTPSIMRTGRLAEEIKKLKPDVGILLGGPHSTSVPEETLEKFSSFTAMVVGEGEQTLLEVVERWPDKSWQEVPGLVIRDENGRPVRNQCRRLLPDINLLPVPAWDLLNGFPRAFNPASFKSRSFPAAHFVTSRGCPYECIFCDTSVFSRSVRYHSAEYVLDALSLLYHRYGVREISFEDDMFMMNKKRMWAICEGMMQKGLRFTWSCNARVNAVTPEILRLFKKSGCWQIAYGIESGSQEILDFARKGIKLEQICQALKLTKSTGIRTRGFFIYGFPKETEITMRRTLDFAKSLPLDDVSVTLMTPFPGSEIYRIAPQYGELEDDWAKMTMLQTVFVPHGLTKTKLEEWHFRFIREFYFRPRTFFDYLLQAITHPKMGWKLAISAFRPAFKLIKGIIR
ncbi:MAG TPA: radical SAM protein [archaeon]|nr:radical SAM protein [archaeon]